MWPFSIAGAAPFGSRCLRRDGTNSRLLRSLAGERFFGRGEAYFADGAVRSLNRKGTGVQAVVRGTRDYSVRLRFEGGELAYDCTCPIGQDGMFCKHCVAVGLAWHGDETGPGEMPQLPDEEAVRKHLLSLDKDKLVSLLLERAQQDDRLERRLTLMAAQAAPDADAAAVWKRSLSEALATEDYVSYGDVYDYAGGIEEVVEQLAAMLEAGRAGEVVALAEHGLAEIEECLGQVDDSDGYMGGLLVRLQELHLEACRVARSEPVALAERLFELETESCFDAFHGAYWEYADILGEAGQAAYRRLAEAEWAKVPALGPGDQDPDRYGRRWHIASIMAAIAQADGDLEALVAVKARDLSQPYAFLEIAQLYREAGDGEQALAWAERGWQAFSGWRRDERLRAFIADAYQAGGRHEEAVRLMWDAFAELPSLDRYNALARHARQACDWPAWRERALTLVRERLAKEAKAMPDRRLWPPAPAPDHSLLVEIFLDEDDPEAAWREAEAGDCSAHLWLKLARRREDSHPADAIRVYERHVAALLRNTGNGIYKEAVEHLARVRSLLARDGRAADFQALIGEIRTAHRRKRNLMKLLDGKRW